MTLFFEKQHCVAQGGRTLSVCCCRLNLSSQTQGKDTRTLQPWSLLALEAHQVRPSPIDDSLTIPLSARHIGMLASCFNSCLAISQCLRRRLLSCPMLWHSVQFHHMVYHGFDRMHIAWQSSAPMQPRTCIQKEPTLKWMYLPVKGTLLPDHTDIHSRCQDRDDSRATQMKVSRNMDAAIACCIHRSSRKALEHALCIPPFAVLAAGTIAIAEVLCNIFKRALAILAGLEENPRLWFYVIP